MITIGVLVSDLFDSYQQTLLGGLQAYADKEKVRILTFVGGVIDPQINSYSVDRTVYSRISRESVDVLLLLTGPLSVECGIEGVKNFIKLLPRIPTISVGIKIEGVPSVYIDNKLGISSIVDHLVKTHNRKNIAFIKGPDANKEAYDRYESYKEGLEANNLQYNYKLVAPGNFTPGDGVKAINLIMETRKIVPDAIVCCDDYVAIEVCSLLKKRGYRVPEDISVTGFDDLDRSRSFTPSLTTVRQPIFSIGYMAGNLAKNILSSPEEFEDILIDTETKYRESCGCSVSLDITSSSKEKVERSFINTTNMVLESLIEELKIGGKSSTLTNHISAYISRISQGILDSYEVKRTTTLQVVMEEILRETFKEHLKGSYWEGILWAFFNAYREIPLTQEEEYFVSLLLTSSLLKINEIEKRLTDFKRIDDRTILEYINRNGNHLLFSKSEEDLKRILRENLSILRVHSCFIVLSEPGSSSGELFFYRNTDNPNQDREFTFDTTEIIPHDIGSKSRSSYVVYPIVVENSPKGYMLIESRDTPPIIFDFLVEKVAYGFKNIEMLKQISSYTEMLERAVEERTKELKVANERLKERSMKDQLTGLCNRRFLDDVIIPKSQKLSKRFANRISYGQRVTNATKNVSFGIIMVDLDHFKQVNDIYGHASGDIVIKELAKIFSYTIRQEDYVVRLGGEEFLLVLREFNGDFIETMVEKVRKAVEEFSFVMENGEQITKTCSLGAIVFPPLMADPEVIDFHTVISIIDKCLYIAKEHGRNRGVIIDINYDKVKDIENPGNYILNNFEESLSDGKISIRETS